MSFTKKFLIISATHFLISKGLAFLVAFGTVAMFKGGGTLIFVITKTSFLIVSILNFPLGGKFGLGILFKMGILVPYMGLWLPIANSLLWGLVLTSIIFTIKKPHSK